MVVATDDAFTHWAFCFQDTGLLLSIHGSWSGFFVAFISTLQEHQTVAFMLYLMAFHLPGKVVALHLENSTVKAYLCNQGGKVSPFFFQKNL